MAGGTFRLRTNIASLPSFDQLHPAGQDSGHDNAKPGRSDIPSGHAAGITS
jgi:hypothetical protein